LPLFHNVEGAVRGANNARRPPVVIRANTAYENGDFF